MSVLRTTPTLVSPDGSSLYHCHMFIVFALYYVLVPTLQLKSEATLTFYRFGRRSQALLLLPKNMKVRKLTWGQE